MAAPRTTRPHPGRTGLLVLAAAGLATVVALAGCTASTTTSAASGEATALMTAAAGSDAGGRASAAAGGAMAAAAPEAPQPPAPDGPAPDVAPQAAAQRSVIRTADVRVELDVAAPAGGTPDEQQAARDRDRRAALATAVSSARTTTAGLGGFVASATEDDGKAELTLRVPNAAFDQARDALATLGRVTSSTETSTDVTAELVDAQSRVDTMTASVARVRQLLAEAQAIGDVLAIESELTTRQAELESWQRQVAALSGQVDLATVTVGFTAVVGEGPAAVTEEPSRNAFVTGLANGWDAFTALFTGVAAVIGALLPFLPVVLVAGWAIWWLLRRRSGRTLPPAPRPAGPVAE